ncbi:hypothetical protein IMZ48_24200, partial [Candidatus Bathyarchaeota archaeon]|nr:hypothetical protein [Candidatus Bathyarchaeota archaeon]
MFTDTGKILSNPITEQVTNRDGIAYVTRRIDMYWGMVNSYFPGNPSSSSMAHLDQLEKAFVTLYQKLLSYQMKSVIRYDSHIFSRLPRDLVKLDDWEGKLNDIRKAENIFDTDCARYDAAKSRLLLDTISHKQHRKEDQECRGDLFETDPNDDKARIEEDKGGLKPEVFSWVLQNADFRDWKNDHPRRLLWVKGDPGKGKVSYPILC